MRIDDMVRVLEEFFIARRTRPRVALGFDGYVDRIAHRVAEGGAGFDVLADFGARLSARAGLSSSFSLEGVQVRPGGNMPNTSLALKKMGMDLMCVGALGYPKPDAAFEPLLSGIDWISYADPGFCLAVEFSDCKMFLSDAGELGRLGFEGLIERVGREPLLNAFSGAEALCLLNWGEIAPMQDIWRGMAEQVLPALPVSPKWVLADIADLTARAASEVAELFETFRLMRKTSNVALSVNDGELQSIAKALGLGAEGIEAMMDGVFAFGALDALVLHTAKFASIRFMGENYYKNSNTLPTRHAESPVLLTGAGDHFNAGLLMGLLAGLPVNACLATGNAASSAYVHNGMSPSIQDIIEEMRRCEDLWQHSAEQEGED